MKHLFRHLIVLLLFWTVVFALQRITFLAFNSRELSGIAPAEVFLAFWYGLRMDLSAGAYLMAIPMILAAINLFVRKKIWAVVSNVVTVLLLLVVLLIGLLDTGIYSMWGSKLNAKAFSYLAFPGEALKALTTVPLWFFIVLYIFTALFLGWIYLKWLRAVVPGKARTVLSVISVVIAIALLFLMMRGGVQKYPMSKNMVYFSRHMVLNNAALNGPWNVIDVLLRSGKGTNPYMYFDPSEAQDIVRELHRYECDSTLTVLNQARPNIVVILLESFSAENLMSLGGKEPIAPGLDSLVTEGLSFTRFYSSGFRTEQGMIALLSAFPAQPTATIMREFGKFEQLPNLGRVLQANGYSCNYYYTGDLDFANTKAYLHASGFSKLHGKHSRKWQKKTQYGALDEELFRCHLEEAGTDEQPFFSILLTSTSHEPFEADVPGYFSGKSPASLYKNTARYTDSCLFAYLQDARRTAWYRNTLFIITADHAHSFPLNRSKFDPERHRIPMILLGGALETHWKGKTVSRTGSQTDFAATLLAQLGIDYRLFERSKNILDPCKPEFAFYAFDNGFGFITPEQILVFDHDIQGVIYTENMADNATDSTMLTAGKAYLQTMFEEYLKWNK